MKVFIPARHGLGDVIDGYFINKNNNLLLSKVCKAYSLGLVSEIIVCYEHFMNPSIGELFSRFTVPIIPKPTSLLSRWTKEADHNNNFPDIMDGYINLLTNTPNSIKEIKADYLKIPTDRPNINFEEKWILLNAYAGESERFLKDFKIIESIKNKYHFPIVSVGKILPRTNNFQTSLKGDIALEDKLSITEVLWLMEHSKFIVSSLSYMRCAATLFNKVVIELVENPSLNIINRTSQEYESKRYGINENSQWFQLPKEYDNFIFAIERAVQ